MSGRWRDRMRRARRAVEAGDVEVVRAIAEMPPAPPAMALRRETPMRTAQERAHNLPSSWLAEVSRRQMAAHRR